MQKQFIKNSFYGLAGFGVLTLSNLIFNFTATRLLLTQFGVYSSFFYLILGLSQPINSLQLSVAKEVTLQGMEPEEAFSGFFGTLFWIGGAFFLIFAIFSTWIGDLYRLPSVFTVWIGGGVLFVMIFLFGMRGIWQGKMNFLMYGVNIGLEGLLRMGVGLVLIALGFGVSGAVFASIISGFLAVLVMLFPIITNIKWKTLNFHLNRSLLREFFKAVAIFLPFGVLMSLDLSVVQWVKGEEWSSYLSACALFGKNLIFLSLILANVVYSYVLKKKNSDTFWVGLGITAGMFLTAALFVLPFGKPLVSLLFDRSFVTEVSRLLPLYILSSLPLGVMQQVVNYSVAEDMKEVRILMWVFLAVEAVVLILSARFFSVDKLLWISFGVLSLMDAVLLLRVYLFQRKR